MTYSILQYLQRWQIEKAVMALRAYFVDTPALNRFKINPHVITRAMIAFIDIHRASIIHSKTEIKALDGMNDCTIKIDARIETEGNFDSSDKREKPYIMVYSATLRESVNSSSSISVSTITP